VAAVAASVRFALDGPGVVVFHESTELTVVLVGLGIRGQSTRGAILDNSAWSPSGIVAVRTLDRRLAGRALVRAGRGPVTVAP